MDRTERQLVTMFLMAPILAGGLWKRYNQLHHSDYSLSNLLLSFRRLSLDFIEDDHRLVQWSFVCPSSPLRIGVIPAALRSLLPLPLLVNPGSLRNAFESAMAKVDETRSDLVPGDGPVNLRPLQEAAAAAKEGGAKGYQHGLEEAMAKDERMPTLKGLGWLDRLLAIWILLAMVLGVLLGNFVPETSAALQKGEFMGVSIPIGA